MRTDIITVVVHAVPGIAERFTEKRRREGEELTELLISETLRRKQTQHVSIDAHLHSHGDVSVKGAHTVDQSLYR